MDEQWDNWLDHWHTEADKLFRYFETVPPEIQAPLRQLRSWNTEIQEVIEKYQHIRAELHRKRLERAAAESRIHAIVERQRIATEMEIAEREMNKWRRKINFLKNLIDRITDKIVLEMRARKTRLLQEQAHANAAQRQQAETDLQMWESFKCMLAVAPAEEATTLAIEEESQRPQQQAHAEKLSQEYAAFRAKPTPSEEDNAAAWADFLDEFDPSDKRKK